MNKHDAAKVLVTDILERHPETRSNPLEVLRLVYHALAYKVGFSRSRIDSTIDTIRAFNAAGVNMETHLRAVRQVQHEERPDLDDPAKAEERDALAAEYRNHYSPKDKRATVDERDQISLF